MMIASLKKQAAAYALADPSHPVWPALELVTVVAQRSPGPSGYYSHVMPDKVIQEELNLANQNHFLLILDVQVGRASVKHWVEYLRPYLVKPNVELAIDPEFDMAPGDIPGVNYGRTYASSINWAAQYLSQIAKRYHQSQKVLIVHQFYRSALPDWQKIHTAPQVALVKDEDAFGGVGDKVSRYKLYIGKDKTPCLVGQSGVCGGFKLFYLQDHPLLTPKQVIALKPSPIVVIYQ